MFFKKNNQKGIILPMMLILLVFISSYIIVLFQAYETNMQIYEQLEKQTERQIHQLN